MVQVGGRVGGGGGQGGCERRIEVLCKLKKKIWGGGRGWVWSGGGVGRFVCNFLSMPRCQSKDREIF